MPAILIDFKDTTSNTSRYVGRYHNLISISKSKSISGHVGSIYSVIPPSLSFLAHLFDIPVLVNLFLFNINTVNMLSMRISFIFLSNGQLHIFSSLLGRHGSEKNIHLFQTAACSVFQEDENESAHGRAKDAKHDESAPADAVDGRGGDLCDDEIKKPLSWILV